jgi:hypothetical protein
MELNSVANISMRGLECGYEVDAQKCAAYLSSCCLPLEHLKQPTCSKFIFFSFYSWWFVPVVIVLITHCFLSFVLQLHSTHA